MSQATGLRHAAHNSPFKSDLMDGAIQNHSSFGILAPSGFCQPIAVQLYLIERADIDSTQLADFSGFQHPFRLLHGREINPVFRHANCRFFQFQCCQTSSRSGVVAQRLLNQQVFSLTHTLPNNFFGQEIGIGAQNCIHLRSSDHGLPVRVSSHRNTQHLLKLRTFFHP